MNSTFYICVATAAHVMAQCAVLNLIPTAALAAAVMPVWQNDTAANTMSFQDTFGHQVVIGAYNPTTGVWSPGSISVGATFTGGLLSIAGSPITGTGTLAFTVAGTSGGIPYFNSATTWASSAALAANQIVLGGGAAAAPSTPIGVGTTTQVLHGNAGGAPTWGAISSADVTSILASPPTIGNVAPNTGTFTGVSALPAAGSLGAGYSLTQSLAGSPGAPFYSNPLTLTFGALSNAGFNNVGFGPTCLVTSASYSGQLFCNYTSLIVSTLGTPGFPNDQFVAQFGAAIGSANTSDVDATIEGGNDNVQVTGTGWTYIVGREIDITAAKAISVKNGLRITKSSTDAFQGTTTDAAIWMGDQVGAVGWKNGIAFDSGTQKPVATAGTLIATVGAQTIANGIDFSSSTISGNFLAGPSSIFSVSGAGWIFGLRETLSGSGGAEVALIDTAAALNAKNWQIVSSGGTFVLQTINDANNSSGVAFSCSRTGFVPTGCNFSGGLQTLVSANASVATVLGSVGPVGSHTAVQEWLQIQGTSGTVRYVPGF